MPRQSRQALRRINQEVERQKRKQERTGSLRDKIIAPKTLTRYRRMMAMFFSYLKAVGIAIEEISCVHILDAIIARYLDHMFA